MPQLGVLIAFLMLASGFSAGRALYLILRYYDHASHGERERIVDKVCTALLPAALLPVLCFMLVLLRVYMPPTGS